MLPVIIGAVSAAGSLLGDVLDQSAARKAQQQAIQAMKALLIPAQETNKRADMYGDDMYTRTMGDLNTGAFAYAGALNPETMRTMAFSKMGTARSQVETGVREEDYRFNKGVQSQIAQIAAQPLPAIDITGAIGAGVGGYFGGKQLEMNEKLMAQQGKYFDKMSEGFGTNSNIDNSNFGLDINKVMNIPTPTGGTLTMNGYNPNKYDKKKYATNAKNVAGYNFGFGQSVMRF